MSPGPVAIGVDVGGTKILAAAIEPSGRLLADARVDSPGAPDGLAAAVQAAVLSVVRELGAGVATLGGVGIALPGLVDRAGILHDAPNLGAGTHDLDLVSAVGEPLLDALKIAGIAEVSALALENDATSATVAEHACGAASGVSDAVVISIGTGIGAGIVSDGAVRRGAHAWAGEIGHMIVERDGRPCPCGRRGCWEQYASGNGLAHIARDRVATGVSGALERYADRPEELHGEVVTAAARVGDPAALEVLEEFASWVALGCSNVVELLDPERIVLGGGLVRDAALFLGPVRRSFVTACRPTQRRREQDLVVATLGDHAACIGAGLLALDAGGFAR